MLSTSGKPQKPSLTLRWFVRSLEERTGIRGSSPSSIPKSFSGLLLLGEAECGGDTGCIGADCDLSEHFFCSRGDVPQDIGRLDADGVLERADGDLGVIQREMVLGHRAPYKKVSDSLGFRM